MDETYGTYVDDEYFDNHDSDDDTDDDKDHKNDVFVKVRINARGNYILSVARTKNSFVPFGIGIGISTSSSTLFFV